MTGMKVRLWGITVFPMASAVKSWIKQLDYLQFSTAYIVGSFLSTDISLKDIFPVFHEQNNSKTHYNTAHWRDASLSLTASLSRSLKIKDGAAVNKAYKGSVGLQMHYHNVTIDLHVIRPQKWK